MVSIIIGLMLLTLREYPMFALVSVVIAVLHIWFDKLRWLAPIGAVVGGLLVMICTVFPNFMSVDWLWRGTSLIMVMTIITAAGYLISPVAMLDAS